jgi:hypothetical protein
LSMSPAGGQQPRTSKIFRQISDGISSKDKKSFRGAVFPSRGMVRRELLRRSRTRMHHVEGQEVELLGARD